MMKEYGAAIIDADELGRAAVAQGQPALAEIERVFGPSYLTPEGELDRVRMAETVFSHPVRREQLNAIVHPHIRRESDRLREMLVRSWGESGWPTMVVHNAALLLECDLAGDVDEIVAVRVSEAQCFRRARLRGGLSEGEVVRRLASQMAQRDKISRADVVIDNRGSLEETRRQVEALCEVWRQGRLAVAPDSGE